MKWLASLTTLSALVLALGLLIALISGFNAFSGGKSNKERGLAALITVLAIGLLVAQFVSSKRSAAATQAQSLKAQREFIAATLGSDMCPVIGVDVRAGQRPRGLAVGNPDKEANIYDLIMYVQEGEFGPDGLFRTVQQQTVRVPTVPAGVGIPSVPFEFLSRETVSYLQFDLVTRRKIICSGLIVLRQDSNGNWAAEAYPVHEGPLTAHKSEIPEAARH